MSTGIYIENSRNVTLTDNRFHNIDRPVVAKGTKGIVATGNVATYGESRNGLKPLAVAIRRIIYGR